jgi:N-acetylneuraminic acid mutarotase
MMDVTASATWSVGSSSVASVSGGVVTGVGLGATNVMATVGTVTGSTLLTVSASGSWHPAGGLLTGHYGATAILLADGKVFIGGGPSMPTKGPYAEIYDPGSQTSTAVTAPAVVPVGETLTPLINGKILKAGGQAIVSGQPTEVLSTVEVFDPATNTWTQVASLHTARAAHSATVLPDGTVVVTGGQAPSGILSGILGSTELYDPVANTWSPGGSLHVARAGHTASLVGGKVLAVGGTSTIVTYVGAFGTYVTATAELYDPATNKWSSAGSLIAPVTGHTATVLESGSVLVAGGYSFLEVTYQGGAGAELYDPAANTWTEVVNGEVVNGYVNQSATLLANGNVLAAGGNIIYPANPTAAAQIFDSTTGSWSKTGDMTVPRAFQAAVLLPNTVVLVCGGENALPTTPSTCEEYW